MTTIIKDPAIITAATERSVTPEAFRSYARITGSSERLDEVSILETAEELVASYLGRTLLSTTLELSLDSFFSYEIHLPGPPLASVTSIKYDDDAGDDNTLSSANYRVSTSAVIGRVAPVSGLSWPTTKTAFDTVRIRYVAGWTTREAIPRPIKSAVLRMATYLLHNRGDAIDELPASVRAVAGPWRIFG